MLYKLMLLPEKLAEQLKKIDFLGPLAIRLYLVPIFWMAGMQKFNNINSTIAWFGNADWGLGLPYPTLMAYLATYAELLGAIGLLFGLAIRWLSIPLIITMLIAIISVHWDNGWLAISPQSSEAAMRLSDFMDWLGQNYPGRRQYITELGKPVILNNGIEFAVTYVVMLSSLVFTGGGRYVSLDYWFLVICRRLNRIVPAS